MFAMMLRWLITGMWFICCGLDLVVWFGLITDLICLVGGFILVVWGWGFDFVGCCALLGCVFLVWICLMIGLVGLWVCWIGWFGLCWCLFSLGWGL